jgi:hypothetical protein
MGWGGALSTGILIYPISAHRRYREIFPGRIFPARIFPHRGRVYGRDIPEGNRYSPKGIDILDRYIRRYTGIYFLGDILRDIHDL